MAYLTSTRCTTCGATFMGDKFRGLDTCGDCQNAADAIEEAKHFAILDKMTLEERVRKLEEDAYNLSKAKPVYVPPPLY